MPSNRVVRVKGDGDPEVAHVVEEGIARIQEEQGIDPEFPPEVEEAAARAAENPRLPDLDRTDIAFITIDPESAMDLDQALHIERAGDGYVVHYAIADVAAFVSPGDPIDVEAHQRGVSVEVIVNGKVPKGLASAAPSLSQAGIAVLSDRAHAPVGGGALGVRQ